MFERIPVDPGWHRVELCEQVTERVGRVRNLVNALVESQLESQLAMAAG